MFTVDNKITDLNIRGKSIVKVFFSMNVHQVAAPDMSLQEARSYVFFLREGRDKISAYVGLHFLDADRKLFYNYSGNSFPDSQLAEVEEESRRFAEDLGAMLDEIDFTKMSDLEKDHWIDQQEIFSSKKPVEKAPAGAVASAPLGQAVPDVNTAKAAQNQPAQPVQPPIQPVVPAQQPAATPRPPVEQTLEQTPGIEPAKPVIEAAPPALSATPVQAAPPATPPAASGTETAVQPPRVPRNRSVSRAQSSSNDAASEPLQPAPAQPTQDVLEQAVKAGIVKAPKAQLRKDIRNAAGAVSRDKEALARLLSSF